jgi:hypothetical protein
MQFIMLIIFQYMILNCVLHSVTFTLSITLFMLMPPLKMKQPFSLTKISCGLKMTG